MSDITIKPLQDNLSFGARVDGVTMANVTDPAIGDKLRQLFIDRGMIVFENMEPTAKMQVALSKVFGPLKDHPVNTVARADRDDAALTGVIEIATGGEKCIVEIDGKPLITWQPWHFYQSTREKVKVPFGFPVGSTTGGQDYGPLGPLLRYPLAIRG